MPSARSLGVWIRLIRAGLSPRSALRLRRGDHDDITFRGHSLEAPDRNRLAWMAVQIWGGEYDLPGFAPRRGDRVADLGANVGVFSVLAAARGATVTAVEPHPTTFASLEHNTSPWSVDCRRAAIVGRVPEGGTVELVEDPEADTAHRVAGVAGDGSGSASVQVPALAFADLLADGYDLVKLDVEGAEFEILENTPTEALKRLRRLVAEVHRHAGEPERLRDLLEACGFSVTITDAGDGAHALLTASAAPASA